MMDLRHPPAALTWCMPWQEIEAVVVHRFEHKVLPLGQSVRQAIVLIVGHLKAGYERGGLPERRNG